MKSKQGNIIYRLNRRMRLTVKQIETPCKSKGRRQPVASSLYLRFDFLFFFCGLCMRRVCVPMSAGSCKEVRGQHRCFPQLSPSYILRQVSYLVTEFTSLANLASRLSQYLSAFQGPGLQNGHHYPPNSSAHDFMGSTVPTEPLVNA